MNLDRVFNDKVIPCIVCDFNYLIISCSIRTEVALNASDALEKNGISCPFISMHTEKLIENFVYNSKSIITLEEGYISRGMGSSVIEACERLGNFPTKIKTLRINDSIV